MSKNGFTQSPTHTELEIELEDSDRECLMALTRAMDTARVQTTTNGLAAEAQSIWQDALENRGRILDALSGLPYTTRKPIKKNNVHTLPVTDFPSQQN